MIDNDYNKVYNKLRYNRISKSLLPSGEVDFFMHINNFV